MERLELNGWRYLEKECVRLWGLMGKWEERELWDLKWRLIKLKAQEAAVGRRTMDPTSLWRQHLGPSREMQAALFKGIVW